MIIYLNGEYVKEEEARLSPLDHGFLYGIGVFETFRLYQGQPFLLKWHMERLKKALDDLKIEASLTEDDVLKILENLLEINQLTSGNARVRVNLSAGLAGSGLSAEPYKDPVLMVLINPFQPESVPAEKEGVVLQVHRNTPEGLFRLKSHHFLNNLYGKRELGNDPGKEGIFLTDDGAVAEGIISNIFWKINDSVFTPSLKTGILDGVTRRYVIELLKKLNIKVMQGEYSLEHLLRADEAWMTNSVQEIVPFYKIGHAVFPGKNGNMAKSLQQLYAKDRTKINDYK
ncbi:aminodeoxychorismate lyase [Bacillus sp. WMMC1349]|uniref:aminodeoxychorismate lyase n=1 Tax=Bacillus sp. WMMC1349 TaxID=2736254 RepID=UPI0015531713|nr:aminodeoxychorismate lyase [Bacillus sp. WMMC1349]NPC90798.1 aminodeoxychorismate lyase [Bacillus sp. WMMC1349]NPC91084.1 aminodeoxychorismate lyase [Bacillus sp. WMMC1349]